MSILSFIDRQANLKIGNTDRPHLGSRHPPADHARPSAASGGVLRVDRSATDDRHEMVQITGVHRMGSHILVADGGAHRMGSRILVADGGVHESGLLYFYAARTVHNLGYSPKT